MCLLKEGFCVGVANRHETDPKWGEEGGTEQ